MTNKSSRKWTFKESIPRLVTLLTRGKKCFTKTERPIRVVRKWEKACFGEVLVYSAAMEKFLPRDLQTNIFSLLDEFNSGVQGKETPEGVLLLTARV